MQRLHLNDAGQNDARQIKRPASAFPARADIYVCDQCGQDVTKYLRPGRAHVWSPMGPEIHVCSCGQQFLTGATEWHHFRYSERKRRLHQSVGLPFIFSAMLAIPGLGIYLLFQRSKVALVTALVIAVFPFLIFLIPFWVDVAASMWRTRMSSSSRLR